MGCDLPANLRAETSLRRNITDEFGDNRPSGQHHSNFSQGPHDSSNNHFCCRLIVQLPLMITGSTAIFLSLCRNHRVTRAFGAGFVGSPGYSHPSKISQRVRALRFNRHKESFVGTRQQSLHNPLIRQRSDSHEPIIPAVQTVDPKTFVVA